MSLTIFVKYDITLVKNGILNVTVDEHLTCFGVEHKHVGPGPQKLLEVFVITDLLDQRGHLHGLQHCCQPHLAEP